MLFYCSDIVQRRPFLKLMTVIPSYINVYLTHLPQLRTIYNYNKVNIGFLKDKPKGIFTEIDMYTQIERKVAWSLAAMALMSSTAGCVGSASAAVVRGQEAGLGPPANFTASFADLAVTVPMLAAAVALEAMAASVSDAERTDTKKFAAGSEFKASKSGAAMSGCWSSMH